MYTEHWILDEYVRGRGKKVRMCIPTETEWDEGKDRWEVEDEEDWGE
jgi:hypothetical protein